MEDTNRFSVLPGQPFPLGATITPDGTNFAVFSEHGQRAYVCLFSPEDPEHEVARHELVERTALVFHGFVPKVSEGALYGFRVDGPYAPNDGHRFNVNKLLMDPYARALSGALDFTGPVYGYNVESEDKDLSFDDRDDAAFKPKCVVTVEAFDWQTDRRPNTAWSDTIIYELHVKGFSIKNPAVPEELRGTYAGLGHEGSIAHFRHLGITAVELLPVHAFVVDGFLTERGLTNYWGYNTLGFMAPDERYAHDKRPGKPAEEFKAMVKALHAAGIEVILDVVFNHTAEGSHLGPTLSFRGLDSVAYYHHMPTDKRHCMDLTGCGNSLNLGAIYTMKLVLDSLRYWADVMHVDGFRFDLATTLGRQWPTFDFDKNSSFFQAVHQDPSLSKLKLIAEPWDVGNGGYQVGGFPILWSEWNGKYRDSVRRFWKGDENQAGEMGYRLTGSSELYQQSGRRPHASVNLITSHDGFTLHDLVSYDGKHNEANGEDSRDGSDENQSWNHGAEGPTTDGAIVALRERQKRNLLTTMFVSRGVPMITAGDEVSRTQHGNNNAYCQDNEISWLSWDWTKDQRELLDFTRRLIRLRKKEGVLREDYFFRGDRIWDSRSKDLAFFRPNGTEMPAEDWGIGFVRSWAYVLGGDTLVVPDRAGKRPLGNTLLILINAHHESVEFTLPHVDWGRQWELVVDTAVQVAPESRHFGNDAKMLLSARGMMVFRRPTPGQEAV